MANIYDRFDKLASKAGISRNTKASLDWFRKSLTSKNVRFTKAQDGLKIMSRYKPGTMVMYQYDPKHKKTLPYYDIYPLVILMDRFKDGWYGLNLHYLSPNQRSKVLAAIITATKKQKGQQLASSLASVPELKPALKKYLTGQLVSKPVVVPEADWEIAISLPFEAFQNATSRKVWRDSQRKV